MSSNRIKSIAAKLQSNIENQQPNEEKNHQLLNELLSESNEFNLFELAMQQPNPRFSIHESYAIVSFLSNACSPENAEHIFDVLSKHSAKNLSPSTSSDPGACQGK